VPRGLSVLMTAGSGEQPRVPSAVLTRSLRAPRSAALPATEPGSLKTARFVHLFELIPPPRASGPFIPAGDSPNPQDWIRGRHCRHSQVPPIRKSPDVRRFTAL